MTGMSAVRAIGPQAPQDLVAVEVREVQIEQHEIRATARRQLDADTTLDRRR